MKINFKKEKNSVLNILFIKLEYMSGDADAYEYQEVSIEGVDYTNYKENLDKIKTEVDKYKLIGRLTDTNDLARKYRDYDKIKEDFGEEIADIWDTTPNDTTCCDYVAHLSDITLCAYNEKGEYLESYT